ncbi:AAA family ATPase [Thomasclavelia cocleata]|uniref:AAA family ATPase n=1 Tax=Thomasclavelia cocleata TaxID=69824 RepID=UPI00258F5DE0|nr:ATP-binding protein [Thomasclavelia cocleata]
MRLQIKNIAKIEKADIEINGITVIAGENNTGKSSIGKILYCLYKGFHDLSGQVRYERMRTIATALRGNREVEKKYDIFTDYKQYKNFISEVLNSEKDGFKSIFIKEGINIKEETFEKLNEAFLYNTSKLEGLIVYDIFNREFNGQITPIGIRNISSEVVLSIRNKETHNIENIDLSFYNENIEIKEKIDLYEEAIYIDNPFVLDDIYKSSNIEYIDQMEMFDLMGLRKIFSTHNETLQKKLSKSFNDNSSSLIEKAILEERLEKFIKMIKGTLQGDILEKENKFVFYDNNIDGEIELSNLSTGIKSFAIILKLIENFDIRDSSLIVLDEPEVHLHPKWQLKFAEILVLIQQEFNLNIILTSHSPYFISAIQAYTKKYNSTDTCKYYLADLNKKNKAFFEDVTDNIGKIFDKLAEPFEKLDTIMYEENI